MKITLKFLSFCFALVSFTLVKAQKSNTYSDNAIIARIIDAQASLQVEYDRLTFNIPRVDKLSEKHGLSEIQVLNPRAGRNLLKLSFSNEVDISRIVQEYQATGHFTFVEPDYIGTGGGRAISFKPDDEFYGRQWSLHNTGGFTLYQATEGADIDLERAWEITKGSEDIIIAVLDSGFPFDHPEFEEKYWINIDEIEAGSDSDQNGYTNDVRGWDFANRDNDPTDDQGHGTNVAGIIGAIPNNSKGYAGINWHSKIMPLKILDSKNYGFYSWWIEAIYYAVDNGARIINMSVGGSSISQGMGEALDYAKENGAIVIACMMNENSNVKFYPAAYESTIAVGSTNPDDIRSDQFPWDSSKGSNYGTHIDICAPGNYIYGLSNHDFSEFDVYWSGTSQAAPHVSAVVGLMLALKPDLETEEVRDILRTTAEDLVGRSSEDVLGWDQYHGAGRLNAFQALNSLTTSTKNLSPSHFTIMNNKPKMGEEVTFLFKYDASRTLQIYNLEGQIVHQRKYTQSHIKYNTEPLSSGVYYVNILENGVQYQAQEFIVQ